MAVRQLNFRVTQQGLDNMPTQKTALTGTHQGQVPCSHLIITTLKKMVSQVTLSHISIKESYTVLLSTGILQMLGRGGGQWEIETYAKACLDPLTSIFVSVIPKMLGYYKVDYKT